MKHVYKDFHELYAHLKGKVVEVVPKEYVPKDEPKAEEEKPKKKATRKKKEA